MDPAEVNDRSLASDGGKITVTAIVEWLDPFCATQPDLDQISDIAPLLLGNGSDARQRFAIGVEGQRRVADSKYLRMTRYGEVGIDFNSTDIIAFDADPLSAVGCLWVHVGQGFSGLHDGGG